MREDGALFGVLDVETTGLSPLLGDRIVEIAVIRIGGDGGTLDEYTTLVNPECHFSNSWIHGIFEEDVAVAPTFHEIAGDVLDRLRDVVLVGHNVKYDEDFLSAELARESVFLPALPSICTLKLSFRLHPTLLDHKLETCCEAAGVTEPGMHSALEDARVAGRLMVAYLEEAGRSGMTVKDLLLNHRLVFPEIWPEVPPSGRCLVRRPRSQARLDPPYLARLVVNRAPTEVDPDLAAYTDLLDRTLQDRRITVDEAAALERTAEAWGLTREQVMSAHLAYMEALVAADLDDGTITKSEWRDLRDVARLLEVPEGTLEALAVVHA